jgi:hypothetical protein
MKKMEKSNVLMQLHEERNLDCVGSEKGTKVSPIL